MAGVWSEYSPDSPPPEEMRKMRSGMLKAMASTWDDFMRTPQFMEMMKVGLNGTLDLRRMARDGMNKIHEQFETPTKEDLDSILLAIRHVERRILDRLEGMDDRVRNIVERIEKMEGRLAKMDGRGGKVEERVNQIDERIGKVDAGIEKLGERIDELSRRGNRPPEGPGKKQTSTK
jgi:chromosome segregation ATPase